jgi:hypothetical protein
MKKVYILLILILIGYGMKGQNKDTLHSIHFVVLGDHYSKSDIDSIQKKNEILSKIIQHINDSTNKIIDSFYKCAHDTVNFPIIINGDRNRRLKPNMKIDTLHGIYTIDPIDTNFETVLFFLDYIKNGDRFTDSFMGNFLGRNNNSFFKYYKTNAFEIYRILVQDKRNQKYFISKPLRYNITIIH